MSEKVGEIERSGVRGEERRNREKAIHKERGTENYREEADDRV